LQTFDEHKRDQASTSGNGGGAGASLLQDDREGGVGEEGEDANACAYEFSRNQERSFSIFMDSLRDTSGATCLVGAASVMATASAFARHGMRSTSCATRLLAAVAYARASSAPRTS
jgi:hypothetical protein